MKITKIAIKNFRSIQDIEISLNDYNAFVGANGSGKSSVLYALEWFMTGGVLDRNDVHRINEGDTEKTVSVTVTFDDLSTHDRIRLEKYGRGNTATFRRSWTEGEVKDKIVGNALQGPDFIQVRSASSVSDARRSYTLLRTTFTDLEEAERLASKDDLSKLLAKWEDKPENREYLVEIDDEDANQLFGFNGTHVIKQCVRLVLVPAASDISSEVAGSKKGSAVNELIGALMADAGIEAREAWIAKHAAAIQELSTSMEAKVQTVTGLQADRINQKLSSLIADAQISFDPKVPEWVPSPTPQVKTDVVIDGVKNDVAKQGHGIQRAVMIAMFQSLVPDESYMEQQHQALEGESDDDAATRLQTLKDELPSLIVCIEEPEIYQHPIRARAFARVLESLSEGARVQIILATHSPYFVRPKKFEALYRFSLNEGKTFIHHALIQEIVSETGRPLAQVEKVINQQLPTTFSEGFFADSVLLVEGDTDKAVLEEIAEMSGRPFDSSGISVLDMGGKGNLSIPATMLKKLGIPVYTIADGDGLGATRKHPHDPTAAAGVRANHRRDTNSLLAKLPAATTAHFGTIPFGFGNQTLVCDCYTIWEDDLEEELAKWPSFVQAQISNGHTPRSKDMLAYRADVTDSNIDDLPECIASLIDAVHEFRANISL